MVRQRSGFKLRAESLCIFARKSSSQRLSLAFLTRLKFRMRHWPSSFAKMGLPVGRELHIR